MLLANISYLLAASSHYSQSYKSISRNHWVLLVLHCLRPLKYVPSHVLLLICITYPCHVVAASWLGFQADLHLGPECQKHIKSQNISSRKLLEGSSSK